MNGRVSGSHEGVALILFIEIRCIRTWPTTNQSVGVALAGVVIYFKPHWQIVDPICTIVFSILICYSTLSVRGPCRDMSIHACQNYHQKPHAYLSNYNPPTTKTDAR